MSESRAGDAIAIIGLAGRFPGARNVTAFWRNLCDGVESISSFTPEELIAVGRDAGVVTRPDYIARRGVMADTDLFDAAFFGFSQREAEMTDPQQRLFMECAWEALEAAGCDPARGRGAIGLYAGAAMTEYQSHLYAHRDLIRASDAYHILFGNEKEYIATRTSYKLDLRGPSLSVNTACSTSLVATALACQGLLNGECDIALAGGVAVNFPDKGGYLYSEGGIMSPDGHCRAFDARADGTVGGNGVGIVVLKRLDDALEDGDDVVAVIKGFAMNNDGARRVGFTAPSIEGQTAVIREALAMAGVDAATVTCVEAHGTGTSLGDPIEVEALTRAFRAFTPKRQFCALGSVKTNVGHLDTAAGVTGLIKVALAVRHALLPPSLHYEQPNPRIDFAASPFYVNATLRPWVTEGPRRAGVSSFGIGGTNVHLVIEQAPPRPASTASRPVQILTLSARTPAALGVAAANLAAHLEAEAAVDSRGLADTAYTLAVGRKAFTQRRAVVCANPAEAAAALRAHDASSAVPHGTGASRGVAMLLTGQGSQYAGMGRELYDREPVFREEIRRASAYLQPFLGLDLRVVMQTGPDALLRQTWVTQPALYVLERALLTLWASWGVEPIALLGHSLGELAAATTAGVWDEEAALRLVAARGRLTWTTAPGAMLSVRMDEREAGRYEGADVSIAALNGRRQVVYSGASDAIARLRARLEADDVPVRTLAVERAFHSATMDPIRDAFLAEVRGMTLCPPKTRFLSNVTGTWAGDEVCDPEYWWRQMRQPVRFAEGLRELARTHDGPWLEVGPGDALTRLARAELRGAERPPTVIASLGGEPGGDTRQTAAALATLWSEGAEVDWTAYYRDEHRHRVALPTYPFERQRYIARPLRTDASPTATTQPEAVAIIMAHPIPASPATRRQTLTCRICVAWAGLLGIEPARIDPVATFFELGVDSLLLIQVSRLIKDEFQVKLSFRRLLEEFTTIDSLAAYLDETMPPDLHQPPVPQAPIAIAFPSAAPPHVEPPVTIARSAATASAPEPFVPYQPIRPHASSGFTGRQQTHLANFIARYNRRTAKSKAHAARHREHFADNRAMQGFRLAWKELVYPIVGARAHGAHMWDLDGNQYVDLTMGFGVHMFGHSPPFIVDAIRRQLDEGYQLGPQSYLAGVVAESVSALTGMARTAYCNSGTEAVMTALRLARAATGRDGIAMFAGSYHGTFDGTLARLETRPDGGTRTAASGPGIPRGTTGDITVLYYDDPQSLEIVRARGREFAAVLVEPIQSRRPDVQPREFLQELRRVTAATGTALIFDDIITGFRIHPGGAQAWFGVRADLATYGKVIAGGMPIGLVSGSADYMGGIDGGEWRYGDATYPEANQIVYAGTFCKHPLSLAACHAVLTHLREQGPELQRELNRKADDFVVSLNRLLECHQVAIRVVNLGSIIRFLVIGTPAYTELFFYHLLDKGVFVWEGRTAFISTAHTAADLRIVLDAVEAVIAELQEGGFLDEAPRPAVDTPAPATAEVAHQITHHVAHETLVPATEQQKQMWALAQLGDESSRAYNEALVIETRVALDIDVLRRALRQVVARHQSLRTVFTADGQFQRILAEMPIELPVLDLSREPDRDARRAEALAREAGTVFDLAHGPLVRALLITLAPDACVLAITAHHTILDGWSGSTLLRELSVHYVAGARGDPLALPEPMQFASYVAWQETQDDLAPDAVSRDYWMTHFADGVPTLALPAQGERPPVYSHAGGHARTLLPVAGYERLAAFTTRHEYTNFITLFAVYAATLARVTGQDDFIIGIHSAGQTLAGGADLIGHCVNLVPLRVRVNRQASFLDLVAACRREFADTAEHQLYPYSKLAKDLALKRDPGRLTIVEAVFNLDRSPDEVRLFGGDVQIDVTPTGYSAWDLCWNVNDTGKTLRLQCDFNRTLYSAAAIHFWMDQFGAILERGCAEPHLALADLLSRIEEPLRAQRQERATVVKDTNLERLRHARRKSAIVSGA
jgi:acyl transferase domain-containing protein